MVMSVEQTVARAQMPTQMKDTRPGIDWRGRALDRAPFLVACLMLALIVAIYGILQSGVFTLDELNLDTAAAMTLMLAATGQTIVLVRGGR
jgi:ribose transport system permease protein